MPGVRPTATAHQPDLETDDTREASRGRSLAGAYPHIFAELHPDSERQNWPLRFCLLPSDGSCGGDVSAGMTGKPASTTAVMAPAARSAVGDRAVHSRTLAVGRSP